MALPDLYSRRRRAREGTSTDVYRYDEVPARLRLQIGQSLRKVFGPYHGKSPYGYQPGKVYDYLVKTMREELAVHTLTSRIPHDPSDELISWLEGETRLEPILDVIELSLRVADTFVRDNWNSHSEYASSDPDQAIAEINARIKEAGIGYEFAHGELITYSSDHMHQEVVLPALELLQGRGYEAASKEYREAHAAFRAAEYETCLVDCAKCLESVLKVIGKNRGWPINENDPASKLIAAAFQAEFIPSWMQNQFTSLRSLLESSVPTTRNKQGGHGAGTKLRTVPRELAELQLHQTAAIVKFLHDHDKTAGS